jgi:hypothetical protein
LRTLCRDCNRGKQDDPPYSFREACERAKKRGWYMQLATDGGLTLRPKKAIQGQRDLFYALRCYKWEIYGILAQALQWNVLELMMIVDIECEVCGRFIALFAWRAHQKHCQQGSHRDEQQLLLPGMPSMMCKHIVRSRA